MGKSIPHKRVKPYVTNGRSQHHYLDKSTLILRGAIGVLFFIFISFLIKSVSANSIAPGETPRSLASHLGLYRLP